MNAEISTPTTETPTPSGSNTCGVIGMILSIIGVCLCGLWLFTIPGLIISLIGLRKEPKTAAITGSVLGGIGILEFLILGPLFLAIFLPAVARAQGAARITKTNSNIRFVHTASDMYHADHSQYPNSFDDLQDGYYIDRQSTKDAWDNPLKFEGGGKSSPVITSAGRDGEFGTDDDLTPSDE